MQLTLLNTNTGCATKASYNHMFMQMFFKEEHKKGRQYADLYELVQHAGYVLPRMYAYEVSCMRIQSSALHVVELLLAHGKQARSFCKQCELSTYIAICPLTCFTKADA